MEIFPKVLDNLTYGVSSTGNVRALGMSLTSILLGTYLPRQIVIRMEGEYPAFADFYLEQLADLARIKKVELSITVARSQGIRFARDWLIKTCATEYLWMGDDDVVYEPDCLVMFDDAIAKISDEELLKLAYINGTKADVNNRRGYRDFSTKVYTDSDAKDGAGYNFIWSGNNKVVKSPTCDTGNLLIHIENVRSCGIRFEHFKHSTNSSGDDTLFALLCHRAGLVGYFATAARSWHLEKPQVTSFNEFAARKNLVYQQAIAIGFSPDKAAEAVEQMLAWEKLSPSQA